MRRINDGEGFLANSSFGAVSFDDLAGETSIASRICCVGMCVLDIIHVCEHYPVEDTDKRCLSGHMQRGGNASNMCTVLRELGYDGVEFLGMMSTAAGFEFLRSDCERRKIFIENCPSVTQNPPFSSVILVENSDSRTIVHSNSNFPILKHEHFKKMNLRDYCWFHFEARNLAETLQMQRHILTQNDEAGSCNVSGSKLRRILLSVEFEKLFEQNLVLALAADLVFLGKELACHMGWHDAEKAVHGFRKWIEEARKQPDIEAWQQLATPAIICPWGALGAGVLNLSNEYSFLAANTPEKIVDALGAGDTFCAATIFGVTALKLKIENAVAFGNKVAGLKLAQYGYDGLALKVTSQSTS